LIPNHLKACLALLLLFSAAAQAQTPTAVPPGAVWIDVPYIHQPSEGCGAASLSMVMTYWAAQQGKAPGTESDVASIQHELYSPRDHGIAAEKMSEYLDRHNFKAFAIAGSWSDLEEQLSKGRPLIVALQPSGQKELHYVVVDGIDSARGIVMVNDPALRKLLTRERAGFEREWSATHNWLLLALPNAKPQ
jgi:ABC-type bacteriocin/lantibiotic exporter with double-glycine peptidase domain